MTDRLTDPCPSPDPNTVAVTSASGLAALYQQVGVLRQPLERLRAATSRLHHPAFHGDLTLRAIRLDAMYAALEAGCCVTEIAAAARADERWVRRQLLAALPAA